MLYQSPPEQANADPVAAGPHWGGLVRSQNTRQLSERLPLPEAWTDLQRVLAEAGELPRRDTIAALESAFSACFAMLDGVSAVAAREAGRQILEYVATRPSELVRYWRSDFAERMTDIYRASACELDEEISRTLRIACTPEAVRGSQLALLGARVYSLHTALDLWEVDHGESSRLAVQKRLDEALALWENPVSGLKCVLPNCASKHFLKAARRLFSQASVIDEESLFSQCRDSVKALVDLCIYEHRWLRWTVPHNLIPTPRREMSERRLAADAPHGGEATALGIIQSDFSFNLNDFKALPSTVTEIRERYYKALTFLMPDRAPPLVLHFRDALPPEQVMEEIQRIQYRCRVDTHNSAAQPGLRLVDSMQWVLGRLTDAKGSLFVLIEDEERTVARAELALFDEQRLPPGVQRVLRALDAPMLEAAVFDHAGHQELMFVDLSLADPRDRLKVRRAGLDITKLLRRAASDFALAEGAPGSPLKIVGICRTHPIPNQSIEYLLRGISARDSGVRVNVGDEIYAVLVENDNYTTAAAPDPVP